jgi:hypothetical protein
MPVGLKGALRSGKHAEVSIAGRTEEHSKARDWSGVGLSCCPEPLYRQGKHHQ